MRGKDILGHSANAVKTPFYAQLYVQVLAAITLGIAIGFFMPSVGVALQPLGDAFIKLVKMIIAPVIFLTIVTGIAGMRQVGDIGRVAGKAFAYFITVSTFALVVGLIVANVVQPGAGMNIDPATLDINAVKDYTGKAEEASIIKFLLDIIPTTILSALTDGSILQVLLVAIAFGVALALVGTPGEPVTRMLENISLVVFKLVALLMRFAPIGAFGAMAFTIGKYGIGTLASLGTLVATFYLTSALFVVLVLGLIARINGFSIFALLKYLKAELLLVLGTSSSEAALPPLMQKMEQAGCSKAVVGLVVPTGYSFNLDGTNIYMTLAALFIAQATGIELSLGEQVALLGVAMISSKGAAGVTGAGFITLAATLSIVPSVPVAGMALKGFSWKWYYAFQHLGDLAAAPQAKAYQAGLEARDNWSARIGIALPAVGVQTILHWLAQTDLKAGLAYQTRVRAHHEKLRRFYYLYVFNETPFREADFAKAPRWETH